MGRRPRGLALALALVAGLAGRAVAQAQFEESVEAVVQRLAEQQKAVAVIDEALRGKKIATPTEGLPFEAARAILSDFAVEVIDDEADGQRLLRVMLQRNVPTILTGRPARHLGEDEPVPDGNWYVSKTYRVRHGDANAIQTALRAEMTRDPRRVGNVLYIAATSTITVTDLAPALRRYERIIAELDRPPARDERLGNVRLDVEVWTAPREVADALRERPAAARETLAASKEARLVTSPSLAAATGPLTPPGQRAVRFSVADAGAPESPADDIAVEITAQPDLPGGRLAVTIGVKVAIGPAKAEVAPRLVNLRAGEWTLVQSGDPGIAVLVRVREE